MNQTRAALGWMVVALAATGLAEATTSWNDASAVRLSIAGGPGSERMEYRIEILTGGDFRVTTIDDDTAEADLGTIMVIAGQAMLVRNLELEEGYEIDALDAPVLMLQVLLSLLSHGVPDGPDSVTSEPMDVRHDEAQEPISVSTTSAGGEFPAPWSLTGAVRRAGESEIGYTLDLTYAADAERATLALEGTWRADQPCAELDPTMPLAGWKTYQIGPIQRQVEGSTIYDYGAQPADFTSKTLQELRQELAQPDPADR